jgi:hypothetical protein
MAKKPAPKKAPAKKPVAVKKPASAKKKPAVVKKKPLPVKKTAPAKKQAVPVKKPAKVQSKPAPKAAPAAPVRKPEPAPVLKPVFEAPPPKPAAPPPAPAKIVMKTGAGGATALTIIRSLLDKLTVERLGLILFSGSAFVQCPLTADRAAFLMFLENVDAEAISSGTTSIGSALNRAVDVFANAPERKNKLILLITDGEDFSLNINEAKQRAIQDQVTLFALGVGTKQGAPIPIVDPMGKQVGHEMDGQGNVQLSTLNETMLKDICKTLQGNYFKAEYQDDDLDSLVGLIKKFEKEQFTDKKLSLYEDHYPWFLGIATALLALEWIL